MEVSDTMEKAFQKFEPAPRRGEAPEVGCCSTFPAWVHTLGVGQDPKTTLVLLAAVRSHIPHGPWPLG